MLHRNYAFLMTLLCFAPLPASAQESWTEIGVYLFVPTSIQGDMQLGNVSLDPDSPSTDILELLDGAAMAYIEHRENKWSFIGDGVYVNLSDDTAASNGTLSLSLDTGLTQIMVEGFSGYRVFETNNRSARFGIDVLGGARYNSLEINLDSQASLLGLTTQESRNRRKEWADGVIGLRAQYAPLQGWGSSVWADIGKGLDSNSYQLAGFVNYQFENDIKLFGGYRQYHFEYANGSGASRFAVDADYSGPMFGISYRF